MNIRKHLDTFMAKLGYVPAAALDALAKPGSIPLKIEVDDSQVRKTLVLLEQVTPAALAAEAALAKLWNIQAAMRNQSPSTGSGGATAKRETSGAGLRI
ncbi:hypothetical protein GJ698_02350 [Pseudoduganella sp. FT26W]|uniref:Uncharacterized protein n=1 Tax=Duganella aquatilis TaxID=2666082 RepID=A0A844CVX7_9BURK|nr:hypothetical protein [Duganella aquatilis]MRW82931.1 hypothetical protein [Duganella aquatilis]